MGGGRGVVSGMDGCYKVGRFGERLTEEKEIYLRGYLFLL